MVINILPCSGYKPAEDSIFRVREMGVEVGGGRGGEHVVQCAGGYCIN